MSNRSKGRRAELEVKEILIAEGWLVELVDMPKRWKKHQDFFSLFDLIAVKGVHKKFIQVKCNKKPPLGPFQLWKHYHGCQHDSVEVWIRKDYKGWRIIKVK